MYIIFHLFLILIVTSTDCPDLEWPFYVLKPWRPNVNCTLIFSNDILMSIEDFHLDASSCDHDYIFFQNRNYCTNFLPEKTDFIILANEPIIIFSDSILVSEFASGLLLKFAINDVDGQLETESQTVNPSTTVNVNPPSSILTTSSLSPIIIETTTTYSPSIEINSSSGSSSTIISQTLGTTTTPTTSSIQNPISSSPSKAPTIVSTTTAPSTIQLTTITLATSITTSPSTSITATLSTIQKIESSLPILQSTTKIINNNENSETEILTQDFSTTPFTTIQPINNFHTTTPQSTKFQNSFPDNTQFFSSSSAILTQLSSMHTTTSTPPPLSSSLNSILDSDTTTNLPIQILSTTTATQSIHTTDDVNIDFISSKTGSSENQGATMMIMIYSIICFAVVSVCFIIIRCTFPFVKDYIWPREFTIEDYLSKREEEEDSELPSEFGGDEENSSSMIDIVRHSSAKRRRHLPTSEVQHPQIVYFEPYLIESHHPSLPRSSPSEQIGEKHWIIEDDEEIVSIAGTHDPLEGYEHHMNFHGLDQLYAPPPRIEEDLISFADTESTISEELRKSYIAPPVPRPPIPRHREIFDQKRRSNSPSVKSESPEPSLVQNIQPYRSPDADLFDEEPPMERQISDRSLSKRTADTASRHLERGERHPVRRVKRRVVRTRDPNNHERIIE